MACSFAIYWIYVGKTATVYHTIRYIEYRIIVIPRLVWSFLCTRRSFNSKQGEPKLIVSFIAWEKMLQTKICVLENIPETTEKSKRLETINKVYLFARPWHECLPRKFCELSMKIVKLTGRVFIFSWILFLCEVVAYWVCSTCYNRRSSEIMNLHTLKLAICLKRGELR